MGRPDAPKDIEVKMSLDEAKPVGNAKMRWVEFNLNQGEVMPESACQAEFFVHFDASNQVKRGRMKENAHKTAEQRKLF